MTIIRSHMVSRRSGVAPNSADLSKDEIEQLRRAVRFAMAVESANAVTPPDLSAVEATRFAYAVSRHRLEICLAPHLATLGLPADVVALISARAAGSRLSAMAVAAGTLEVSTLLSEAGVRALIFKGCALAAQSTGDFTVRGAGDVDVLVHPRDVEAATRALEGIGFRRGPYLAAKDFDSRQWRYARWVSCEFPLSRGRLDVDLHWALTNVRDALPAFDDLWRRRDIVDVSNRPIPTLGLADALAHSCAHSLKDQWRWIRALVDIDRLARLLPVSGKELLAGSPAVQLTASVTLETTNSRHLVPLATKRPGEAAWARRGAARAQRSYLIDSWDRWTPRRAWRWHRQQTKLNSTPGDWMRHLACFAIPATAFTDTTTGEGLSAAAAGTTRARRAVARLAGAPGHDTVHD